MKMSFARPNSLIRMLKTLIAGLFLVASSSALYSQTAEVGNLKAKRQAAIDKIEDTYRAELGKLKLKYEASGDTAAAKEVSALLDGEAVSNDAAKKPKVSKPLGAPNLDGKWRLSNDGTGGNTVEFSGGVVIFSGKDVISWSFTDNQITLKFSERAWEKYNYDFKNPDVMRGFNYTGAPRVLTRIKIP
ncbi:MAG: hypothetical protein ABIT37_25580 [Luteolibacter sp.]